MSRSRLSHSEHDLEENVVTTASGTHDKRPSLDNPAVSGTRRAVGFGTYRLFARLGSGGMADVYLAVTQGEMNVHRLVVIKRLREEQATDAHCREMFLTEARIAARLNHPNVIQTFEAGREADNFFMAMEYVDGQPLSRLVTVLRQQNVALEPRLAARICADALQGLHYAHELTDFDGTPLEIVHRDISPQNIMVSYDGAIKLVDFGIAKAVGTAQTAHGVFKGKVAFMAPEQVRGEQVDRRADLFAAGIVLWEAVTGTRLMADRDPATTLYNLLTKDIPRASEVNPDIPEVLDAIIDRALQRDLDARYQTAKAMRDDLEAFVSASGGASQDEVGTLMKSLFAEQREKVQSQVRSQLAALSLRGANESGRHPTAELSRTQIRQMTNALTPIDDGFASVPSGQAVVQAVTTAAPAPPTRRFAAGLLVAVSTLALAASGLALFRSQRAEPPAPIVVTAPAPAPSPTEVRVAAAPSTAAPPPAETVTATPSAPARPITPPRAYTPPPRSTWTAPSSPSTASADAARNASAPTASSPPQKPQDAPQGRTFRRDL